MTKPFIRLVLSGVLSALAAPSGQPLFAQADHYGPDATARTPKSKDPRHFVVVSKSHFDIGYSALARDVEHEYRTTMIDRALETMEQNAKLAGPGEQFVWTIPGWPMQTILWDGQNPARQQRIEEALKRGNLVMHALPYTIETASPMAHAQTITLPSLLAEMTDPAAVARFPQPRYQSLQASSYNRASTNRNQPNQDTSGWYADSDGVGFIRTESINGKQEWVIMEHQGPGCLTKLWTPFFYYDFNDRVGANIRIYLDGSDTAVIDESLIKLVRGESTFPPPLATPTARAGNSYVPIPFAKSCKITMVQKPFYIDIRGQGVFVGDAWTVLNIQGSWWGEGDEKIYVDDAWDKGFPTHFGTGTEDYYGWAGGEVPTRQDEFSVPFLANARVGGLDGRTTGFNICTRTRSLDAIPFTQRLRFDMESSFGTDIRQPWNLLGYSAVTFWYAKPGATHNRPALPAAAAPPIMSLADVRAKAGAIKAPAK